MVLLVNVYLPFTMARAMWAEFGRSGPAIGNI